MVEACSTHEETINVSSLGWKTSWEETTCGAEVRWEDSILNVGLSHRNMLRRCKSRRG
jgi:hypothetical protein